MHHSCIPAVSYTLDTFITGIRCALHEAHTRLAFTVVPAAGWGSQQVLPRWHQPHFQLHLSENQILCCRQPAHRWRTTPTPTATTRCKTLWWAHVSSEGLCTSSSCAAKAGRLACVVLHAQGQSKPLSRVQERVNNWATIGY